MGQSGKKKSGKKGKKGGKKRKTKAEPEMSWKEAVLAYQINIKEKALEDVRYELNILEGDNQRLKERCKQLKEEQEFLMDDLLKAAKETDKNATQVTKDEVIAQMKVNWATRATNAKTLEEINGNLAEKEEEILSQRHLVEYWKDYQDRGQHEQKKQIFLLQEAMTDLEETFETMTGHMTTSLTKTKEEIEKNTIETLDQQKYVATEKAIAKMDKYTRREVIDNDWLTCEIEMHRRQTAELLQVVEKLEEENLQTLCDLFQCQMEDLRISRSFFMTQFLGTEESLDETLLQEIDLSRLKMAANDLNGSMHKLRPKSAIQKAVEDKVFSLPAAPYNNDEDDADSDFDGVNRPEGSDDGDPFADYMHLDDDFDSYLRLGPLELKLLNVTGEKLSIHKPNSPPVDQLRVKLFRPDEWPVTRPMLMDVLSLATPRPENPASSVASK